MIANLTDLVAPLDEAEFFRLLKNRELKLLRRPGDGRFAEMYNWPRLRALIEADRFKPEHLRITWKEKRLGPVFYRRDGKIDPALLAGLLERGASVIANRLHRYVPEIAGLCAALDARTGERAYSGAIVTTGSGGALPLHYDDGDIVVVQIEGSKRWRVYDRPVMNPVTRMLPIPAPDGPPLLDTVLEPGDLLFVPGGYWHHCENGPGLSHHIGISFTAPTGRDAFQPLLEGLAEDDLFRVRLSRLSEAERAAHEAALRARLIEKIRLVPLEPAAVLASMNRPRRPAAEAADD